jgi:alpha(1,3/1,4) fucosyltransferase
MKYSYFLFGTVNSQFLEKKKYKDKLKTIGLVERKNPFFAKLIICRNVAIAKKAALLFPFKKIIVYQYELFIDTTKTETYNFCKLKQIVVVNGFNGGIFFNNFHFLSSYICDDDCDLGLKKEELILTSNILSKEEFENAAPLIFVGQKRDLKEINKSNSTIGIDLNEIRQEIAQCSYDKGVGIVLGNGWNEISGIKNSGFETGNVNWWDSKLELLKGYRFNIALENTIWKYYVSEKIWHSIKAGCLPIYWGKDSSIYETFPRDSFIDASEFKNSSDLIDYIVNLSYELWRERMEKCVNVYNESMMKMNYSKFDEAINKFLERINK